MNKAKPLVQITLDKERNLLLNLNTMVKFEEITGKNLLQSASFTDLSITDLRVLVWACLLHEDKELTLDQVGEMVDVDNLAEVSNKLAIAWGVASPEVDKESPLLGKPQPG